MPAVTVTAMCAICPCTPLPSEVQRAAQDAKGSRRRQVCAFHCIITLRGSTGRRRGEWETHSPKRITVGLLCPQKTHVTSTKDEPGKRAEKRLDFCSDFYSDFCNLELMLFQPSFFILETHKFSLLAVLLSSHMQPAITT